MTDNDAFAFAQSVDNGADYAVTISTPPDNPIQPCTVSNASGMIDSQDITDVVVTCEVGDDLIFRGGFE